jgi:hypothetical protein
MNKGHALKTETKYESISLNNISIVEKNYTHELFSTLSTITFFQHKITADNIKLQIIEESTS